MKIEFRIEKRHLAYFVLTMVILTGISYVVAYGTNDPPTFGHTIGEIDFDGPVEIPSGHLAVGDTVYLATTPGRQVRIGDPAGGKSSNSYPISLFGGSGWGSSYMGIDTYEPAGRFYIYPAGSASGNFKRLVVQFDGTGGFNGDSGTLDLDGDLDVAGSIKLGGVIRDSWPGCDWTGWDCHCREDHGSTHGVLIVGMYCQDSVLDDFKIFDFIVGDNYVTCPTTAPSGCNSYTIDD